MHFAVNHLMRRASRSYNSGLEPVNAANKHTQCTPLRVFVEPASSAAGALQGLLVFTRTRAKSCAAGVIITAAAKAAAATTALRRVVG